MNGKVPASVMEQPQAATVQARENKCLGSSSAEKDLWILVHNRSQWCALAAKEANHLLDSISGSVPVAYYTHSALDVVSQVPVVGSSVQERYEHTGAGPPRESEGWSV